MALVGYKMGGLAAATLAIMAVGCTEQPGAPATPQPEITEIETGTVDADTWPSLATPPLDPAIEAHVDDIISRMTLEQKVGQVIQADSNSVTPEQVKAYRLGSVLSGGNSAPGPLPYADTEGWLKAADAFFAASLDPEGVEIAIPIIWGIDAVHGHTNLLGATVFPHNIGLGAANNPDLIEEIARITALELSVSGHDWTFAPTLAVPQNDRWGRTYEGFSEDPAIVASYGDRIVYGLQGVAGTDDFMGTGRVISSAKHFLGDGGTTDGIDQGDTEVSEAALRDIHGAGYVTAVEAGVQTVMASFSAWNGQRMHGHKELLTDVLKDQMNFQGFVIGDWNGHGLIEGCTATDCPQSLNAGLDMYMAPDSWEGLWHSTLAHVQSGTIPMKRLDDAVRRILRVKVASGVFEAALPSERPLAGNLSLLAAPEHRAVARQAVRESLVLLKNEGQVLPLPPTATVLVVGDGADDISKVAGGWTLSWQGGGYPNDQFPNGQTILSAIEEVVGPAGGEVIYVPHGETDIDADVVVAIYGEDPYAEFQGDRSNVDFVPNGFDPQTLTSFQEQGTPVVSVFVSGRPLWTNPELNVSDAFIAAWLPGSEGGGIADMLFRTDDSYDFTGRLSFSWPKTAAQAELNPTDPKYDPLFPLGFGLSYADDVELGALSTESGLDAGATAEGGPLFARGTLSESVTLAADGKSIDLLPYENEALTVRRVDYQAQEDSLSVAFSAPSALTFVSGAPMDLARQSNGGMELAMTARVLGPEVPLSIGMGCADHTDASCSGSVPVTLDDQWAETRISLSCFAERGAPMAAIETILAVSGTTGQELQIAEITFKSDIDATQDCGDVRG
ncbi:MAG: glycoside hydrolase family 3 N-terminal domain-containing protein [Pseudomonadota bacterium]